MKTNKEIVRKRRVGGGRKPKGPIRAKSQVFTTRITADTRAAIEAEARRSEQSISQVAERLLVVGLETRRRRQNNRSIRALCFLIENLAVRFGLARWMDLGHLDNPAHKKAVTSAQDEWRTDPFRYSAFTIAVQSLLDALKPPGEITAVYSPNTFDEGGVMLGSPALVEFMKNKYASPENLAAYTFADLWSLMQREQPLSSRELDQMRDGEWVGEMMREEFYGVQDASNDLKIRIQEDDE